MAIDRLSIIAKHDALILLRSSMSHQKLLYTLRCCPCIGHVLLDKYDALLRDGLSSILNIAMSENQWIQASLPIKIGGLGIRRTASLALPAFLASAAGTRALQSAMLGVHYPDIDERMEELIEKWKEKSQMSIPEGDGSSRQSNWDGPLVEREMLSLHSRYDDPYHKARLGATAAAHSGDWLLALPLTSCGLRMDDESIRIAVCLRLGATVCEPHACPCGALVTADGSHGLSCGLGPGRIARHAVLNDLVSRSLTRAGVPNIKEPPGLSRTDGKRPDGLTLIPWSKGRCLVWDVTVTDTVAPSYLHSTAITAGAAAEQAATRKDAKYSQLLAVYHFVPIAFETLGPINTTGLEFIKQLGRRLTLASGDKRETSYLFQRLSVVIQRFNAIAFRGSFVQEDA
jgi:hypothetical protein